jgi:hypothetical protein
MFKNKAKHITSMTNKDIWPWVFFNKFVGFSEGAKSNSPYSNSIHFRRIRGLDIPNETGAFQDFANLFRIALRLAKENNWPGVLVDPEAYNDYRNYSVQFVAKQQKRSIEDVTAELKNAGAYLLSIAEKEYPEATLWFLFTRLSQNEKITNGKTNKKDFSSVSYILIGMLEKAKEVKSSVKIICGAESFLGYCNTSLNHLQKKIATRGRKYAEALSVYPNLVLGGTIAPWGDVHKKTRWMQKGVCEASELKKIEDFKPLFEQLLTSYNYVWIYAASAAGYFPYDPEISIPFNRVLTKAIRNVQLQVQE